MPFAAEIRRFAGEIGSEIAADLRALTGGRIRPLDHKNFLLAAAALFIFFHQLYFWTGKELLLPSGTLFMDNGLYGWDCERVVDDMMVPGHNARSNVHPLFILYAKPLGAFYSRVLHLTKHTSAIGVSSTIAATNVAVVLLIFTVFGAGLVESALFAAIFGASTTNFWLGAIPETGCFSILSILIVYLLSALALKHGMRSHLAWLLSGLFTYGNAVTNFAKSCAAFFLVEDWAGGMKRVLARLVLYAAVVVAAALILTMWAGSSLAWMNDRWVATASMRAAESEVAGEGAGDLNGLASHMVRCFFAHTIVAPSPMYNPGVKFHAMDGRIVMFNYATYRPFPGALAIAWLSLMALSLIILFVRRDRADLRFAGIIATSLIWDFIFFSRYYVPFEGVFVWSPHYFPSVFMLSIFLVPSISRAKPAPRNVWRAILAAFVLAQVINNFAVLRESVRLLTQP